MKEYDELETKQKCVNEMFKFNNDMFCNNENNNNGNPFMNMVNNTSSLSNNGGFFSTNTNYNNNNVSSINNNNNVHSFFSSDNDDNINEDDNLSNHNPFLLNNIASSSLATPSFNNIHQQQEISINNNIDYNTCSDKYILTNLSEYDFTANKYISKGNGYITIEKHNNTYYIIYRNTTYRILLTCIIYPQTTSFTPSTQTPFIAVINKLLNITLSPHKPCSLKLKFQTQSDRTSFQTIFTNITTSSSSPSNEPITHISSLPVYTIYLPQFK
jgi:hypothetical protein